MLERDTTREIAIPAVYRVLDISADGRLLLVLLHGGLVLYDVDADSSTPVKGMGSSNTQARLLAPP